VGFRSIPRRSYMSTPLLEATCDPIRVRGGPNRSERANDVGSGAPAAGNSLFAARGLRHLVSQRPQAGFVGVSLPLVLSPPVILGDTPSSMRTYPRGLSRDDCSTLSLFLKIIPIFSRQRITPSNESDRRRRAGISVAPDQRRRTVCLTRSCRFAFAGNSPGGGGHRSLLRSSHWEG